MGNHALTYNKIMIHIWFVAWMCITLCNSQQPYDISICTSNEIFPGSRYTCNSTHDLHSCKTFLVYRSNQNFNTISQISNLFNKNTNEILHINNLTSSSQVLKQGKEVLIPVECTCSGQFYQTKVTYKVLETATTFSNIACEVFEGLVKNLTLAEENHLQEPKVGDLFDVPLRCTCPQNDSSIKRVKYFLTYPLIQNDDSDKLSKKFGFSTQDFLEANELKPFSTIYPDTVVLIPLSDNGNVPIKIFDIPDSPSPPPGFLPTNPLKPQESTQPSNFYIAGPIIGFLLLLITLVASGLYMKKLRKNDDVHSFINPTNSTTTLWSSPMRTSTTTSCLSPDFLVGLKYCLLNYHIEEVEKATNFFSDENKFGDFVYKGMINDIDVMVKRLRFEETSEVIDLHSRINHINIVNLLGVCYGESINVSMCYLVFELPKNGCLRDCLIDPCNSLNWFRRIQIVFDIATCLYYLHYCSFPSYAHMNVNSRNIFITENWRGKLADVGGVSNNINLHGSVSQKVDIFSFGVVLLELISGREKFDGKSIKDCIGFLLGEGSDQGGCFEGLRSFMDPNLKDYSLPQALCLCFLAKDCVKDDPLHRPTMDDIMKVLAKMV
ncbi:protein LYK5-like [Cicer arietinum]|uniref:Protein LYK5-like n=1 Tax=Cicer arietinum TaxID=3827 RepID=A0A1S2YKL7_CICAR|nr:protein LYK5-like [Cicer arietinum]